MIKTDARRLEQRLLAPMEVTGQTTIVPTLDEISGGGVVAFTCNDLLHFVLPLLYATPALYRGRGD